MPFFTNTAAQTRARERESDEPSTRVQRRRLALGFTIAQLARRSGVGTRTINRLMKGQTCQLAACKRVAAALDIDPLDLWPHLASDPNVLYVRVSTVPDAPAPKPPKRRAAAARG